ncbi:ABC transporter ATP-binding protein [Luedemannella helvata]|uniref:ABC transporter ATP-binding protein n=1 Tax=Luedemannella helvata TaxID=349315 RepID=A0ABP4W707_9ACTN
MTITVTGVSKAFGGVTAVDDVTFTLKENRVYGLLGRNGAGKTTLMQLLTGQLFRTAGDISVFGADPVENEAVLTRMCFIKESQRYPDQFQVRHVLASAAMLYPNWDADFAAALLADFALPTNRRVKKLSRGMLSALGVIVGLAARAPVTLFDEPYLGLDAVARQLFYDRLLADVAEHPRTVVLSTHLIDEVADLLEHVIVMDRGRIVLDREADALRGEAALLTGPSGVVDELTADLDVLHLERLGAIARVTVRGVLDRDTRDDAAARGVTVEPATLQQLFVRLTTQSAAGPQRAPQKEATR